MKKNNFNTEKVLERLNKAIGYLIMEGYLKTSTQKELAEKMKKNNVTNVNYALNGDSRYLTEGFISTFNKAFDSKFNLNWLLNGEPPMLINGDNVNMSTGSGNASQNNGDNNDNRITNNDNHKYYNGYGGADEKAANGIQYLKERMTTQKDKPKISYTEGKPYYNVDFIGGFDVVLNDQTVNPDYLIDFAPYNKDGVKWCNITGHSMEPLISNGDIIALKRMEDWREFILYGEVYGIVTEDMRTVKIVTKSSKGEEFLRLVPANKSEEYQPQDIPVKLITHVFKVLGCMKKL